MGGLLMSNDVSASPTGQESNVDRKTSALPISAQAKAIVFRNWAVIIALWHMAQDAVKQCKTISPAKEMISALRRLLLAKVAV